MRTLLLIVQKLRCSSSPPQQWACSSACSSPSASQPGLYFGLAKIHKVPNNSKNVNDLPLRPIISNCGTATYEISRYLAGVLSPLTKNDYTILNTLDFVNRLKGLSIGADEKMVSFDVSSLFSNVPLDFTIDVILRKIYDDKIVKTKLSHGP